MGTKISFWAAAGSGAVPRATTTASRATTITRLRIESSCSLVRKWPQPKLLLADLPQASQPVRLHDEKEDDEAAEDHALDLLLQRYRHRPAGQVRHVGEKDRHQHDERRAEKRAEQAAQPADDDHEEHEEREVDVEGQRLGAAEVEEHVFGSRHPA